MKKQAEALGKSVEEAKQKALEQLGEVDAEKVEYIVLEEAKKGFLGIGASPARVLATYTVEDDEPAVRFIKTMIADMGLQLSVRVADGEGEDDGKIINIEGEGAGVLIGHHGDTLDALQYLASLAANRKENGEKREYVRVTVDVEGYRAKRAETLRALARRMAEKVLKYKKSVMLEPMNPYERRIIHSEVQKIGGVSSNSIGSENNRRIVIYLEEETPSGSAKTDAEPRRSGRRRGKRQNGGDIYNAESGKENDFESEWSRSDSDAEPDTDSEANETGETEEEI